MAPPTEGGAAALGAQDPKIKGLVKRRALVRASLDSMNQRLTTALDARNINELKLVLGLLKEQWTREEAYSEQIIELLQQYEDAPTIKTMESEITTLENERTKRAEARGRAMLTLENNEAAVLARNQREAASAASAAAATAAMAASNAALEANQRVNEQAAVTSHFRLTPLELPEFDGDPYKWYTFWEMFEVAVHKVSTIATVEKFTRLISRLKGPALDAIAGIPITEANYQVAVDKLTDRYGRKDVVFSAHMAQLMNVPAVHDNNDLVGLRNLVDQVQTNILILKNLGTDIRQYEVMLTPIFRAKLPFELDLDWQERGELSNGFMGLLEHVQKRVRNREECLLMRNGHVSLFPNEARQVARATSRTDVRMRALPSAATLHVNAQNLPQARRGRRCAFCDGGHTVFQCELSLGDRCKALADRRLCFACLRPNCRADSCSNPNPDCRERGCGGRHHTAICRKREARRSNSTQQTAVSSMTPTIETHMADGAERGWDVPTTAGNAATTHSLNPNAIVYGPGGGSTPASNGNTMPAISLPPCDYVATGAVPKVLGPSAGQRVSLNHVRTPDDVQLQTATVIVNGPAGWKRAVCLIDVGSQRTFIKSDLARQLELPVVGEEHLAITTFGQDGPAEVGRFTRSLLTMKGTFGGAKPVTVEALEKVEAFCSEVPAPRGEMVRFLRSRNLPFADDRALSADQTTSDIDILIGADCEGAIVTGGRISGISGQTASKSKLGWLVHGPIYERSSTSSSCHTLLINALKETSETEDIRDDLFKFWSLEHIGIVEEEPVEELPGFSKRITQSEDGRYRVPLPWKGNENLLLDNRADAERKLKNLLRSMSPDVLQEYQRQITQYLDLGMISRVNCEEPRGRVINYMPHRPVIKRGKPSWMRIVFNASAKFSKCPSLNDTLHIGTNLFPPVLDNLLHFRMSPVAFIGDLEKAFLQLEINPEDRDALRFLFVEAAESANPHQVVTYRWNRVPFGLGPSPFLLGVSCHHHLDRFAEIFPETTADLKAHQYVDDFISGETTVERAFKRIIEATELYAACKMNMTKWETNKPELTQMLQKYFERRNLEEDTATSGGEQTEARTKGGRIWSNPSGLLGATVGAGGARTVLGMGWHPTEDHLFFNPDPVLEAASKFVTTITKRQLIRIASMLFDPLGLLGPVTIQLKMLFQSLWKIEINWDQEVPPELFEQFRSLIDGITALSSLTIPRWCMTNGAATDSAELHLFADASLKAYGAVAYLRFVTTNGSFITSIICSKGRVVPVHASGGKPTSKKPKPTWSIARLELLGLVVATRLANHIKRALNLKVSTLIWSDSMVALHWILGEPFRWSQWIRNRVLDVQQQSDRTSWKHCPGLDNPADLVSRGVDTHTLMEQRLWWEGPCWLRSPSESWPKREIEASNLSDDDRDAMRAEEKRNFMSTFVFFKNPETLIDIDSFSSHSRLIRVTAWVRRFVRNLVRRRRGVTPSGATVLVSDANTHVECLSVEEIVEAEMMWARAVQQLSFPKEYAALSSGKIIRNSPTLPLGPRLDPANQVIRVTGRVERAFEGLDRDPPILLPSTSPYVEMLIRSTHRRLLHSGAKTTLTELRECYWIVRGRQQVRKVLRACTTCNKQHSRHFDEPPASLPPARLREANPFEICGVDFAGPVYARAGRQKTTKTYICVFTCPVTRAVFLELVPDLTVESFLLAARRLWFFFGVTSLFISDNAKTFYAACKSIKALQRDPKLRDLLAGTHTEWKFIASRAPWWGGFWERMVRTTKELLRKTLRRSCLNFEEIRTTLFDIASIINSRPLVYISEADGAQLPLTPSHLISGRRSTALPTYPPPDITADSSSREALIRRERHRRFVLKKWWGEWKAQYLLDLSNFHTPLRHGRSIREGEVVLVQQDNTPRLFWKSGIVTKLHAGDGGRVRAVTLKTDSGIITRPIQKLYPTEASRSWYAEEHHISEEAPSPKPTEPPGEPEDVFEPAVADSRGENVGNSLGDPTPPPPPVTRRGRPVRLPAYLQGYVTNLVRVQEVFPPTARWTERTADH